MYEVIFLIVIGLIWIVFASVQDLRKREVANWLNFSLIIFVLGFRFFYSLFYGNFSFFYQGLIGLGIFLIIGNLFYYGRIFAGGDAKLMISLGGVLPFSTDFFTNIKFFSNFLLIFLFCSFFYILFYSLFLTFSNLKYFKKEFLSQFKKNNKIIFVSIIFGILILISGFWLSDVYLIFSIIFGIMLLSIPFIYIYSSSVDKVCMIKQISPGKLTEGDWLYKDVKIGKKLIKANWDGLNKEDIILLKKNKKTVLIRQGIPFVPVFLISFLLLIKVMLF